MRIDFLSSGTISDLSHQNHDVNAHSILTIQKDWVIYGTPIADLSDDGARLFPIRSWGRFRNKRRKRRV